MQNEEARTVGLLGATGVGVGAIVGGGIFVLAGVAFSTSGPGAMVAFAINGVIAFLTAMTFAEISSAFPESGGAYTFAKKVLSVRAAFATGWILWFAYVVAGVLYALGFAAFAVVALQELWGACGASPPTWFSGRHFLLMLALSATVAYALNLARSNANSGSWATTGKVAVFAVLVVAGFVAFVGQPIEQTKINLSPFFSGGGTGLVMAMGFTFIALQGFDLIAAIAGKIENPGRVIPRAMFLSLGCALVIYLPLLLFVSAAGVAPGETVSSLAEANPETIIAIAAKRFLGVTGYWLVIVAALLSTLSALEANLLAASHVSLSMARDRTLPAALADLHSVRKTPVVAIGTSTLMLATIIFMVPDIASAGAAASLIFLISFTLAHITTYLARRRGGTDSAPYKTPWFPLVPVVGGLACAFMALFQAVAVPDATGILIIWAGLGILLYWTLFARRAEAADAASSALNPALVSLRGHAPLILVPIANPAHTPALISVANILAARRVGRVMLLSVVPKHEDRDARLVPAQLKDAQQIIYDALAESYKSGHDAEGLITSARAPMEEIRRIAEEHRCAGLLMGMGELQESAIPDLELLLNDVDCDVALLKAPQGWHADDAQRILVPVGGRSSEHEFRVRLLASLCRASPRQVTFVSVVPLDTSDSEVAELRVQIGRLAEMRTPGKIEVKILKCADGMAAIRKESEDYDLIVLGLKSVGWGKKVIGAFARGVAANTSCAALMLSRRRNRSYEFLDPLRDDVLESLREVVKKGTDSLSSLGESSTRP